MNIKSLEKLDHLRDLRNDKVVTVMNSVVPTIEKATRRVPTILIKAKNIKKP